jgi:hypothetical protein
MTAKDTDNTKLRVLASGIFDGDDSLQFHGGQAMRFKLKNLNILGAQIRISAKNEDKQLLIPPLSSTDVEFTCFRNEPMYWEFDISTISDAFKVQWILYSTWIPGDPPNP